MLHLEWQITKPMGCKKKILNSKFINDVIIENQSNVYVHPKTMRSVQWASLSLVAPNQLNHWSLGRHLSWVACSSKLWGSHNAWINAAKLAVKNFKLHKLSECYAIWRRKLHISTFDFPLHFPKASSKYHIYKVHGRYIRC